jgi:Xaa-Pro aminopeptidase
MLIQEKVKQARSLLGEFGVDCWITFVRESAINGDPTLTFLAGTDVTWHSAFIIHRDGSTCAIVGRYDRQTIEDLGAYDEVIAFVEGIREPFQEHMKKKNPEKIAVNYSVGSEIADGLTHGMYLTLHDMLGELGMDDRLISAERLVSALRERKSAAELEAIRGAVRITEQIWEALAGYIKPGLREKDVAAFVREKYEEHGVTPAWDVNTCPAVFSGPGGAEAHYAPGETVIEKGHVLNMDFGVRTNNYVSDTQRTFYILEDGEDEAPEDVLRGFQTIVKAIEQARLAMRPGVEGREVDAVARGIITNAGYDEFPHALGHQLGIYAHDGTALLGPAWEKYAQKPFQKLEEGMVFTIEPRLTVKGRGIVTVEEMVVMTEEGARFLTHPQEELILIR